MPKNVETQPEKMQAFLVEDWIGPGSCQDGLEKRTHEWWTDFFERDCGLASDRPGVRRSGNESKYDRFTQVFVNANSEEQARILDAVLKRFPQGTSRLRTADAAREIEGWVKQLKPHPKLRILRGRLAKFGKPADWVLRIVSLFGVVMRFFEWLK